MLRALRSSHLPDRQPLVGSDGQLLEALVLHKAHASQHKLAYAEYLARAAYSAEVGALVDERRGENEAATTKRLIRSSAVALT